MLIDIVNFNGDASCLSSARWLEILTGGNSSLLCSWLTLYVKHDKVVNIGFTGATLADIAYYNPEAIDLIRRYPDIFRIVLRPFSHDLGSLRSSRGFNLNVSLGKLVIDYLLQCSPKVYLPPEFVLTSRQVCYLSELGVTQTFLLKERFSQEQLPIDGNDCYLAKGIPNGKIACHLLSKALTDSYLESIQLYRTSSFQSIETSSPINIMWRDGESCFLLPDSIQRENYWLENNGTTHVALDNKISSFSSYSIFSYPVHPLSGWLNHHSMIWLINEALTIENNLPVKLTPNQLVSWLGIINSDHLSSIEKKSPVIQLKLRQSDTTTTSFKINREPKSYEAEQWLCSFYNDITTLEASSLARKAEARLDIIHKLYDQLFH
jgi:hypothetical protein